MVQGGFALVLQACIYRVFIKLTLLFLLVMYWPDTPKFSNVALKWQGILDGNELFKHAYSQWLSAF
jgi:hypothetical protein